MSYRSPFIITELCHMRNTRFTKINPLDIIMLDIRKKPAHCYDIEDIAKFRNLEKIYILTDEQGFVSELVKNIDLFENLYELSVIFKINEPPYYVELVDGNCHDVSNVLLIKNLEQCTVNHKKEEVDECINCITLYNLQNTRSSNCIIQNFTNDYLLNSLSAEIKKLIIVVNDLSNFRLDNLPFFLERLTIVYKNLQSSQDFYSEYKSKIKLPYNCKLKIIQDYGVLRLEIDKRHLNINDE